MLVMPAARGHYHQAWVAAAAAAVGPAWGIAAACEEEEGGDHQEVPIRAVSPLRTALADWEAGAREGIRAEGASPWASPGGTDPGMAGEGNRL